MRPALLTLLPLLAIAPLGLGAAGCGGDGLPSGSWHGTTAGGVHGGTGSSSTATGGGTGSGGSGNGAASSGQSSSGAGETSGSGGGETGSSSGGAAGSSSGGDTGASSGGSSSGNGSGSGGSQVPPSAIAVTLGQSSAQLPLMDQTAVSVSIAPNGYRGVVQLAAASLPSGVTATFAPASVTLDGATTATAQLTLASATDAAPGTASLSVGATADGTTESAPLSLEVQSVITLHIPQGVNSTGATITNPDSTAFGPYPIKITAPQGISAQTPVTVYFQNDDDVSHEIHADATAQGFGHDPGPFGAGKMDPYVRKVNSAGTYDFYLHDQGAPLTIGRIFIQ